MQIDPSNKYHLIGIGGDGMSALATILLEMGAKVVGSDIQENKHSISLREAGVQVYTGHKRSNIARNVDAVIVSSAIDGENPEIKEAKKLGIPVHKRLTALAGLMQRKKSIGVAGTHGKSTTTTMAATLLECGGHDPTFMIGADSEKLGGNSKLGEGKHFIAEVDESDGHFLQMNPEIGVVTNVGRDHLDTYRNQEEIIEGFTEFVRKCRFPLICEDDPNSESLLQVVDSCLTFGIERGADFRAKKIVQNGFFTYFDLYFNGEFEGRVKLPAPGIHNVYNALAALGIGHMIGMEFQDMIDLLREFQLPRRRFQVLKNNGCVIIDDYAHLPEEIEVTLEAVKSGWDPERVVAVFQPHRFSRTKHINGQFGKSFRNADTVIVTDIYPAFERPIPGITSQLIFKSIEKNQATGVHRIENLDKVYKFLQSKIHKGDFVVGLGAGDIWKLTHKLAKL